MGSSIGEGDREMTAATPRAASVRLISFSLAVVFGVYGMSMLVPLLLVGLPPGWDAIAYTDAARAWLEGGDPWAIHGFGIGYNAPPTSFLPYVPFVIAPDAVIGWTWIGIAAASALYVLRKLDAPLWWLLFPPVTLGIAAGSTVLPVTALLVRGGVIPDAIGVVMRVYAAIPLALLFRWRSIVVAGLLLALTLPMWPAWWEARDQWQPSLALYAADTGASGWLIPVAVAGLVLLGRERAAWLVVPALWPDSQPTYAVIALPVLVRLPIVALSMAIPIPGLVAFGLLGEALLERRSRGRLPNAARPIVDPPARGVPGRQTSDGEA